MKKYQLNEFDPLLKSALWTGKIMSPEGEKVVILHSVDLEYPKVFHFELKEGKTFQLPSLFKRLFMSIRPFSLTATLTPGLVVLGAGLVIEGWKPNFVLFALSLISVACLQASVNLLNDVYDHLKGIDFPGDIGGSGVIQKGWLSAKDLFIFAFLLAVGSIALGLLPVLFIWKRVWWIAILGLVGGLGYSGLGIGFKYRALGDLVVFILCGPALGVGFSLVTFGNMSSSIICSGFIFGFAALGILHANNLNDLEVDQKRGARTIANQIGFKRSQKYFSSIYYAIFIVGLLAASVLKIPFWFSLAPFLTCFLVFKIVNKVRQASGPLSPAIARIRFEAAQIHLMLGFSFLIVLSFAAVLREVRHGF